VKVALLGTGLMGAPMGRRLIEAGHELTVWNRSVEKAEALAADGAVVADTPAEATQGAEAVVLMLLDGEVVEEVLFALGVADALPRGRLIIDMSTISPMLAREHAERLRRRDQRPLDAPVSGGTRGAALGTLTIMVGGEEEDFARAAPLLTAIGKPEHVGESGAGQLAKAANQLIVAVTIGAVAEAFTLVDRAGVDPGAVRLALLGGFAESRILREHGERMLERDFTPGATVSGQLKDLRIIEGVASELGLELPLSACVTRLFAGLAETEHARCDHSALLLEIERRNQVSEGAA
jgi:3-hydroxyisobutyrate dehydrogenase-like beta-hydroxyacid dehydrogenase